MTQDHDANSVVLLPSFDSSAGESLRMAEFHQIVELVVGGGWGLCFEPEPDGRVRAFLLSLVTGEVLDSATGRDYDDAWLGLGIDIPRRR